MIAEMTREEFLSALKRKRANRVEKIKAYSAPKARYYKTGKTLLFILGSEALIFGQTYSLKEMNSFLSFMGVSKLGGSCEKIAGTKQKYLVMKARGMGEKAEEVPILPKARILADAFGLDLNALYPDLCSRINKGAGVLFGEENSAAFLHKSPFGDLLASVAVKESAREKGEGKRLVKKIIASVEGDIFTVCEEALKGFYEASGFAVFGELYETKTGEN